MSIPTPTTFADTTPALLAALRAIVEGNAAGSAGLLDLLRNVMFLHAYHHEVIVNCHPRAEDGYIEHGTTSKTLVAGWRRYPLQDCASYTIVVLYENTGTDGTIHFDLVSDTATYTTSATLTGSTAKWGTATLTLTKDPTQSYDTLQMHLTAGASGVVRVHHVLAYGTPIAAIAAGASRNGVLPVDSLEGTGGRALSVELMRRLAENLDLIRRKRGDTLCSWSDGWTSAASTYYKERTTTYDTVIRADFPVRKGQSVIQWAAHAHLSGSGTGSLRIRTGWMISQGIAAKEVSITSTTWAAPYTAQVLTDAGADDVTTSDKLGSDYLEIALKGDGSIDAVLRSFSAWFDEATE